MGQPTSAIIERLGISQLWYSHWVVTPIRYFYYNWYLAEWFAHRFIILFLIHSFYISNIYLWGRYWDDEKERWEGIGFPRLDIKKVHARFFRQNNISIYEASSGQHCETTYFSRRARSFYLQSRIYLLLRGCFLIIKLGLVKRYSLFTTVGGQKLQKGQSLQLFRKFCGSYGSRFWLYFFQSYCGSPIKMFLPTYSGLPLINKKLLKRRNLLRLLKSSYTCLLVSSVYF